MADEEKKPMVLSSHVLIKVIGQDKNEVMFRVKRCMSLKVLMDMYCERQSVQFNTVAFLLDGKTLRPEQTAHEVGLEDGDMIDAMLHQSGGAATSKLKDVNIYINCYLQLL